MVENKEGNAEDTTVVKTDGSADNSGSTEVVAEKIEVEGAQYALDKDGNALDAEGKIFMTKEQIEKEFEEDKPITKITIGDKELNLDKDGNAVDENNVIVKTKAELAQENIEEVSIPTLKNYFNINPVDDKGNEIQYENSPKGIASFINDVTEIVSRTKSEQVLDGFFQRNPDVLDIYKHKQLYGTIDNYKKQIDYTKVVIDDKNENLLQNIIINERLVKGDTKEQAIKYVEFIKSDNGLVPTATESLKFLQSKQAERDAIIAQKEAADKVEADLERTAYWNEVNSKINSGKLQVNGETITIPEVMQINRNGKIIPVTRKDFIEYISVPLRIQTKNGIEIMTRHQYDEMIESENATSDNHIYDAFMRFTRTNKVNLQQQIINEHKVAEIRKFKKRSQSDGTTKIEGNKGTNKIKW